MESTEKKSEAKESITTVIQAQEQALPEQAHKAEASFEMMQRRAKALASSSLIPTTFQNNIPNTMIALEIADRVGASPMMVMQNLYIVHGKPSWSSSFIIGLVNQFSGFSPLRFIVEGDGETLSCYAICKDSDGIVLKGPKVTYEMAKKEGWVSKSGSKWLTMPELMIQYRAATFFGRLYCPNLLMGMHTDDENTDIEKTSIKVSTEKTM